MFSGGTGTEQDPFIIRTVQDLLNVKHQNVTGDGKYYYLQTNNIDLKDVEWEAISSFKLVTEEGTISRPFLGYYDGGGYSIINFNQKFTEDDGDENMFKYSLFGQVGGHVKNLKVVNAYVDNPFGYASILAMEVASAGNDTASITDCHVSGTVKGSYAAGFITFTGAGIVERCSSDCDIQGVWASGFSSWHYGYYGITPSVIDCYALGTISEAPPSYFDDYERWYHFGSFTLDSYYSTEQFKNCYSAVKIHVTKTTDDSWRWPEYEVDVFFRGKYESAENNLISCYVDVETGSQQAVWNPSNSYYSGSTLIRGSDGVLYRCIRDQTNKDYGYWEDSWDETGPPPWWPPPFYRAEPGIGEVWRDYWAPVLETDPEIARTTEQMKTKANYVGWDFENVWKIVEGKTYPRLRTRAKAKCKSIKLNKLSVN